MTVSDMTPPPHTQMPIVMSPVIVPYQSHAHHAPNVTSRAILCERWQTKQVSLADTDLPGKMVLSRPSVFSLTSGFSLNQAGRRGRVDKHAEYFSPLVLYAVSFIFKSLPVTTSFGVLYRTQLSFSQDASTHLV